MSEPSSAPPDDDFFTAVEQYVTPTMAAHGYVVCSAGEGSASHKAGNRLQRVPGWRAHRFLRDVLRPSWRRRWVRHLSVGYEGDSGNEFWIEFYPEQHDLDLTCWHDVLRGRADFDVIRHEPVARDELRRRLRVLGEAVRASGSLDDD